MSFQSFDDQQMALDMMAQLHDPQWALEASRAEDEADCEIGAGREWGVLLRQMMSDPEGFHQFQRLRQLVLKALCQILSSGNLGAGLEAAFAAGRERLLLRLQHPDPELQAQLKAVLAEDLAEPLGKVVLSDSAQHSLQQAVGAALLPEDWEAIAIAAASAIQQYVTHHLSVPQSA
ncbi:hypothetical protein [Sphaerothrix gracilis]|uniref:hypothetical protein n=1 Tax=Sphaerothrix gracilis TaxID=3151835 RepID=UPI0031FCC11F